jgi:hypothetical protein
MALRSASRDPVENQSRAVTLTSADPSDNAFTLDGLTFDPGTDGYEPLNPLTGIPPLLKISGVGDVSVGCAAHG